MPYSVSNPPEIIKGLPPHAQKIWVEAFNSALANLPKGRGEEYAYRVAWSAVKKAGYRQTPRGEWHKTKRI